MAKAKAKPAGKPKAGRGKKADGADSPPVPLDDDVPIGQIDPAPAFAVRQGANQDAVDRYAEADRGKAELPRLDVYRYTSDDGRPVDLLADGGHRYRAYQANGRKKVRVLVRVCGSKGEAERLAYDHAAGANATHGLPRTPDDRRAAVAAVMVRPEYESASDRKLADLCRVTHVLVRLVREELSARGLLAGKASADARDYKKDANLRGGWVSDGKGGVMPPPAHDPAAPETGRATGPESGSWRDRPVKDLDLPAVILGKLHLSSVETCGQLYDRMEAGETFDLTPARLAELGDRLVSLAEPAAPDSRPAAPPPPETPAQADAGGVHPPDPGPVLDEKGRPVPGHLLAVFAERPWFRSFGLKVTALLKDAEAQSQKPAGDALAMNPVRVDGDNFAAGVKGAMPYVVCPTCDGEGVLGSRACCPDCPAVPAAARGRGWLSVHRFHQLPAAKKRKCDGPWSRDQAA